MHWSCKSTGSKVPSAHIRPVGALGFAGICRRRGEAWDNRTHTIEEAWFRRKETYVDEECFLFGSRALGGNADELSAACCSSFQLKSTPEEFEEPGLHPSPCASPYRSELSSGAACCCRGLCCTSARFLPLRLLWPPRAKVPNLFCIACFRSGPRRSESARLAAGTDAAHTLCALRCWTLLTQPLPAPRRLPYGSLRLWACATMTVSSRRALSLHACVTARDVSRALRAATAAPLRCRAQVCEVAGILLNIVAPRLLERGVGVLRADVGREVLLVEGDAPLLAANRPPLDRH